MKRLPKSILWIFESYSLEGKKYLKELDFIKENIPVDHVTISARGGVNLADLAQCHSVIEEIVEHAHKLGLGISLHLLPEKGLYNASPFGGDIPQVDQTELFPIPDPMRAAGIANDIELVTDENGYARYKHTARWARKKIMPIYSEVLRAYSFEGCGEGFYKPETLTDVTDKIVITNSRPSKLEFEVYLGEENKNKNVFVLLVQYYNRNSVLEDWKLFKRIIDAYSDIPLDGFQLDEYGYMLLNQPEIASGKEPPFRGRHYSSGMKAYYENELGIDLDRLLFDMRYAPLGEEKIRIKAINTYFEKLRIFPLITEQRVYEYTKEKFGEEAYISCHNTFHNYLDVDEIWRTACNWWSVPRDFGHTDENIGFPVRWGIMLATEYPITVDMFYAKDYKKHFEHMIVGAPLNCREFFHAYDDFYWGSSFTEPELLEGIRKISDKISHLDSFQKKYPKMDMLVIYGAAAQNNWYPDYDARNAFDIDGTLHIQGKCDELWNAGYRCALVPDYLIEEEKITLNGDKISIGGYDFSHCIFLYPKYAKKETYSFLNEAYENGVRIAAVGRCDVDFNGDAARLYIPVFDEFSLDIPAEIGCKKSAVEGGCIYEDGSFAFVSHGILTGETTSFDFELDGKRISGAHSGILAFREGEAAFASEGSCLFIDGEPQELETV